MSTARPLTEPGRPQHTLGRGEDSTGPGGGCRNGVRPLQGTSAIQPRPLVTTPRREDAPCHGSVGRLQNHSPARRPDRARPTPDRPRPLPLAGPRLSLTQPGPQPWTRTGPAPPPSTLPPASLPPPLPPGPPPPCYLPRTTRDPWTRPWDASSRRRRARLTRASRGARGPTCARAAPRAKPPRSAPQLPACCAGGRPGRTLVARTARHVGGRPC